MARSTNKTNGASQPRNSQRRSSQAQNGRVVSQDDENSEVDESQGEEGEEDAEENDDDGNSEYIRKANALARLALFNEYRRMPLRRDEINKKVLGGSSNGKTYQRVFFEAQQILKHTFGMTLVELMTRAELQRESNENDETGGDINATGLKKKTAAQGSKSYILRSNLDPELVDVASVVDESIRTQEIEDIPEEDEDEDLPRPHGSIISWSSADQTGAIGILYVILSLILVSGGVLSDIDLKKYLKSLRLEQGALVQFSAQSTLRSLTMDQYLAQLNKQYYLEKQKNSTGGGAAPRATQGKRGRRSNANDDENASVEWRWGARARAEVGEDAIGRFIGEFMVERTLRATEGDDDDEEEEESSNTGRRANGRNGNNGRKRRDRKKERETMLENVIKDITRAAGGALREAKTL